MKKYNVKNYIRYKEDVKASMPEDKPYDQYTRNELIIKIFTSCRKLRKKICNITTSFRCFKYQ